MRLTRLIAAIGLSAALCATPVMSGSAFAVTRDHTVTFYFSDDTYTRHVGTETQSCSGQVYKSGEITPYSQEMISTPCQPSPLDPTPPFLS